MDSIFRIFQIFLISISKKTRLNFCGGFQKGTSLVLMDSKHLFLDSIYLHFQS